MTEYTAHRRCMNELTRKKMIKVNRIRLKEVDLTLPDRASQEELRAILAKHFKTTNIQSDYESTT